MVEKPFQNISNFDKIFSALSSQMNKTKGGDHTIISRKEKNPKKKKKNIFCLTGRSSQIDKRVAPLAKDSTSYKKMSVYFLCAIIAIFKICQYPLCHRRKKRIHFDDTRLGRFPKGVVFQNKARKLKMKTISPADHEVCFY